MIYDDLRWRQFWFFFHSFVILRLHPIPELSKATSAHCHLSKFLTCSPAKLLTCPKFNNFLFVLSHSHHGNASTNEN